MSKKQIDILSYNQRLAQLVVKKYPQLVVKNRGKYCNVCRRRFLRDDAVECDSGCVPVTLDGEPCPYFAKMNVVET